MDNESEELEHLQTYLASLGDSRAGDRWIDAATDMAISLNKRLRVSGVMRAARQTRKGRFTSASIRHLPPQLESSQKS